MLKKLEVSNQVLHIVFGKELTKDDVSQYRTAIDSLLQSGDQVGLLCDLTELDDLGTDAIFDGIKADLKFLANLKQFRRIGFVTDRKWLKTLVELMESPFNGVEMKVFKTSANEDALAWVYSESTTSESKTPAIRFLETDREDVLAFEYTGHVSSQELPAAIDQVNEFLEKHQTVRMLARVTHLSGMDVLAPMQSGLVAMKLAALAKVERYAVVGAPGWMKPAITTMDAVFPDIDMRAFDAEHEEDAWTWLGAKQIQG